MTVKKGSQFFSAAVLAAGLLGAGCSHGPAGVPRDARRVDSGQGEVITKARHDGEIWVVDGTSRRLVWNGQVRKGERIALAAGDSRLEVGQQTLGIGGLDASHRYVVYQNP